MHYRAMFRGDYIAAVELPEGREVTRTIRDVRMVAMEQSDGTVKEKPVCYFRESDRGWVLNRTNAECLAAMFGEDTADWSGSRVTIHREQVSLGRDKVPGIRVEPGPRQGPGDPRGRLAGPGSPRASGGQATPAQAPQGDPPRHRRRQAFGTGAGRPTGPA